MVQQQQQQQQQIDNEESCNDIVAQSDYEAALAAIESTFDNFQVSLHRGHENENENKDHSSLDQELIEEIYRVAKTSLLNNVKRAVRPINDNAYDDYVDQYHISLEEESVNDGNDNDNDNDFVSSDEDPNPRNEESDDGEEEDEEIDNEELVDMKAWKDAQELRTRIRAMSNTVQSVRERVLKRTEDAILSSTSKQLVDNPVEIVSNNDADDDMNEHSASNDKENSVQGNKTNCNKDSSALQDSLRDLSKILQDPKWKRLPNRIQSLQETLETVQKETTEDRAMSQTEIAITSQYSTNTIIESSRQKILDDDKCEQDLSSPSNNNRTSTIDAMDRLALFGQLFS
jgi:hypothetical protein